MTHQEKVFELLYNSKLAWTAEKHPLTATINGQEILTDNYGIFKSTDQFHLGTCKERYHVFQNHELAETIVEASGSLNLTVKSGGMLQNGKKVFLQVELPSENIGNSGIKRYLTALNSHDGSTSIGFGTTNTVVVCRNTFFKALQQINKIRHTQSYSERIKSAIESIKTAIKGEQELIDNFKRMSDKKIDDDYVVNLVQKIMKVEDNDNSTRKANQITKMAQDIRTDMNIHGGNLWGLFNGITRYTNHSVVNSAKKDEYVMVGQGSKINELAYQEIMKQINSSLKTQVLV